MFIALKISLSKKIKNGVKPAVKFINDFEKTAADIAISNHYDFVVCGHIHQPEMRTLQNDHGSVTYLNSGDWIENLTALEYADSKWSLYKYSDQEFADIVPVVEEELHSNSELFNSMLAEFNLMKAS